MAAIRSKDTKPEMMVRSLVHGLGFRYRLHRKDLPGSPDLVFASRNKVIFVHGYFWHQHPGCRYATRPATRADFWAKNLDGNTERDQRNIRELKQSGWGVLVIWECQLADIIELANRVCRFLDTA
jgi:DNA mismatch endonuclease (patch repair protein)